MKQLVVIMLLLSIYKLLYIFKRLYKHLLIKPHGTPERQTHFQFYKYEN